MKWLNTYKTKPEESVTPLKISKTGIKLTAECEICKISGTSLSIVQWILSSQI